MQGVLMKTAYLWLRRLVLWFNGIMERDLQSEPLPFPVPSSKFLAPGGQEQMLSYLLQDFSVRPGPASSQPLCERVPNQLLVEYKTFMSTLFRKPFAQIFSYMPYITALNKLMKFVCADYCWPAVLESDLGGINARALHLLEKEMDSATLFQSLHSWMELNGEPDMSDNAKVSRAFFSFINHLDGKDCKHHV